MAVLFRIHCYGYLSTRHVFIDPNKLIGVEGGGKVRRKETGFVGMERSFRYEGGVGGKGLGIPRGLPVRASQSFSN
jgi:hypothetical protein